MRQLVCKYAGHDISQMYRLGRNRESTLAITIRNLSDEVCRVLRERAAQHGRSLEAEIAEILEAAVKTPEHIKRGSVLAAIGREVGLTADDCSVFDRVRDSTRR